MCSDQDQAFRHRVKLTLGGDLRSPEVEAMLNVQEMGVGLGGSLKALSRVCSVLNTHAAPYIFHVSHDEVQVVAKTLYIADLDLVLLADPSSESIRLDPPESTLGTCEQAPPLPAPRTRFH